jgi:multiple sugar transport system permease protein
MRLPSLRAVATETKLLLIGIPLLIWTMLPIYHLFLFAISPKDSAFAGNLWPTHPTLRNFAIVFGEQHYYLSHFWRQLFNSLLIAISVGAITLLIAATAAFAISRLKARGGRLVMNLALFTYFIPAAFLAVPMYRTMGLYGLLNSKWALIWAMVAIAAPYAIWVLKQASDKLPYELDEAALMDGATPAAALSICVSAADRAVPRRSWHQCAPARLERVFVRFPAAFEGYRGDARRGPGQFSRRRRFTWELLMATGLIYALPPAIYYTFKRYMVSGLTAGAVKG